jgi:protein SCO1/2
MAAALAAAALAAAVELVGRWRRPAPPPRLVRVPDFTLRNRDGRFVARADLLGAPWVADFVFTRCAASCPLMSARMARLDRRLPAGRWLVGTAGEKVGGTAGSPVGSPAVRLVSFTVDPDFDTPAVLARYAASFGASPRWLFLSGGREAILRLSRDGFRLAVGGGGPAKEPILHSTRFILVDGQGWIRRYYDALDPAAMAALPRDAEAVAAGR